MALTYTFHLPGNCALRSVKVYNAAGSEVSSGTTDGNATYSASLVPGDYTAKVERGRISYTAAGEAQRPGGSDADADSSVTSVDGATGAVDLSATYVLRQDTGQRQIDLPSVGGFVIVWRQGDDVEYNLSVDTTGASGDLPFVIPDVFPAGFRPSAGMSPTMEYLNPEAAGAFQRVGIGADGSVALLIGDSIGVCQGHGAFRSPNTFPADPLPGVDVPF